MRGLPPWRAVGLVGDLGRIINNSLEMESIGDREPTVAGIFAGKDCSRGVASAGGGRQMALFSAQIIILSASMTKVGSSYRLGRVPTCKTGGVR